MNPSKLFSESLVERVPRVSRRSAISLAGGAMAGLALGGNGDVAALAAEPNDDTDFQIVNGRIRQSVMGWCFNPMPNLTLAGHCKAIGMPAIEGIDSKFYPQIKAMGLNVSIVSSHGFRRGFCNPDQHEYCIDTLRQRIELAAAIGCNNVITFTGMAVDGLDHDQMTKNCVKGWKKIIGFAEEQGINLCLEHLNSRDDSDPMKGHPGYFGDDVDHCVAMIKQVGSPRMKLLFDVYHVQIMNGDIIRRIRQYKDYIGHYHTAGNPGRGELDETQEINYPAVMRTILETGYEGYVAQEFIPTWEDKVKALRHAVKLCDV